MRNLDHKNLIKLYEIFEGDDSFYLIMEYMKGGNLEDWLETNQPNLNDDKIKTMMKVSMIETISL